MHILYLNPVAGLGGGERVLLEMISAVRRLRPDWRVSLIVLEDGPLVEHARDLGCETTVVSLPDSLARIGDSEARESGRVRRLWGAIGSGLKAAPGLIKFLRRLRQSIRVLKPDLVHSNGIKTHLLGRLAVPRGVPIIWHVHDYYSLRPSVGRLLRRASAGVRRLIAISRSVAEDIAQTLPGIPVSTIANCVDPTRFFPGPARGSWLDELAGLPTLKCLRVGLVATYANWKGQDIFLRAVREIISTHLDLSIRFYVVGGPIYRTAAQWSLDELRSLATSLGIIDHVGFVPFQKETADVYRSLDIVVHGSTLPEPFGLTVAEAMSCGRATIVSKAGGAAELFEDGVDAMGFEPGSVTGLSKAISTLIGDADLRERLANRAAFAARERFSQRQFAEGLLAADESVSSIR